MQSVMTHSAPVRRMTASFANCQVWRSSAALTIVIAVSGALAVLPARGVVPRLMSRPCALPHLRTSFVQVAGARSANHVTYELRVTNLAHHACRLGAMRSSLLGTEGTDLPSRHEGGTGPTIVMAPRQTVISLARFTSKAPAPRESRAPAACEPDAEIIFLAFAGVKYGKLVGIQPQRPVCHFGAIRFSRFKPPKTRS